MKTVAMRSLALIVLLAATVSAVGVDLASASDLRAADSEGEDAVPPAVTYPAGPLSDPLEPIVGTIIDTGSGVSHMELVAVDLGAAGATGIPADQLTVWDGSEWTTAPEAIVLPLTITNGVWTFEWNPVTRGSGSYVIGLRAFNHAGNKWPTDKNWQAIIVTSDSSPPGAYLRKPSDDGNTIRLSGTASDNVAIRKVRVVVADRARNELWNGTTWVSRQAVATDPGVVLTADLSNPLSTETEWTFEFETPRRGGFMVMVWAQNGAYQFTNYPQYRAVIRSD